MSFRCERDAESVESKSREKIFFYNFRHFLLYSKFIQVWNHFSRQQFNVSFAWKLVKCALIHCNSFNERRVLLKMNWICVFRRKGTKNTSIKGKKWVIERRKKGRKIKTRIIQVNFRRRRRCCYCCCCHSCKYCDSIWWILFYSFARRFHYSCLIYSTNTTAKQINHWIFSNGKQFINKFLVHISKWHMWNHLKSIATILKTDKNQKEKIFKFPSIISSFHNLQTEMLTRH